MRPSMLRGLFVVVVAGLLLSPAWGQKAKKKSASATTPTILFVCEHGAAKSVISAAYFDKFAQEKGLKYKAIFRGTNPDPVISPITEKGLKEDGLDTTGWQPKLITKSDMEQASQIITLGCTLPDAETVAAKVTDWKDVPNPSNYTAARDAIKQRVQALVDELAAKQEKSSKKKMFD